jgi:molybdopterin biosynthesis enzyme MoaB
VTTPRKITDLKRKIVATTGAEAFMGRAVAVQIAGREVIIVAGSMVACNEVMRAIGIHEPDARLSNHVAVIQQRNCSIVEKR